MSSSVLVVDDQPLFCSGMQLLIEAQPDLVFAGAAHSGSAAVAAVGRTHPDVVLMDLRMPDGNGLEATRTIGRRHHGVRVLILTTFRDQDAVQRALAAGAAGFVTKDATPPELLAAIRDAAAGRPVGRPVGTMPMLPDPVQPAVPDPAALGGLTAREQEIFLHVARGLTNGQIAVLSHISENTVRNHVGSVLQKLHLGTRTQVAVFAYEHGLVPVPRHR